MPVKINNIEGGSPAQKAQLSAGETILSVNGNEINDMLDYGFHTSGTSLQLALMDNSGKLTYKTVVKDEYQPLGCEFESYLMDKKHSCKNKCMFCFIDQLPENMRDTLYFKDDDERLSFLFGNYITLTNLSQREVDRIIAMNISPVNISVHTTNPELRVKMMSNPNAGAVLRYIDDFAKAGIKMNCQLVLCSGINDNENLKESINTLANLFPSVQSVAAVPAGLTKYRDGLYPLTPYDKQTAQAQLDIMLSMGDEFKQKLGVRLIYPGDEWFLLADRPIPSAEFYDDFLQLENGVGMWRLFHDEFIAELEVARRIFLPKNVAVVTGTLAYPLIYDLCRQLRDKHKTVEISVYAIKNEFFGGNVSVAGLVTGQDIIAQLKGKINSKVLCVPETMLRSEKDRFLDDITIKELEKELKVKVRLLPQDGAQTLKALSK